MTHGAKDFISTPVKMTTVKMNSMEKMCGLITVAGYSVPRKTSQLFQDIKLIGIQV